MDVKLVMFKADGTRRDFTLTQQRTVLGRTNTADLRIPLSSVSRQHCEITVAGGEVRVRDMGSSNGTYHNGTRIQEAKLTAGDEVVIGPVTFTVVIDGQPSQVRAVRTLVVSEDAQASAASASQSGGPQPLEVEELDDEKMPEVESEHYTPTVDLDDPLAALQRLDDAHEQDDAIPTDEDDDIPLLADEDDEDDDDISLLTDDSDEQNNKN